MRLLIGKTIKKVMQYGIHLGGRGDGRRVERVRNSSVSRHCGAFKRLEITRVGSC